MKKSLLALAAAVTLCSAAAQAATVYFENTADWNPVYVWQWGGPDATNTGSWPGTTTLQDNATTVTKGDHTYFKWETECTSIIFTNGNGAQTKDLQVIDKMIYTADGSTGESFEGGVIEVPNTVFLAGGFSSWGTSDPAYELKDADGDGVYTLSVDSFNEEFKLIENGAWMDNGGVAMVSGVGYEMGNNNGPNCTLASTEATNVVFSYVFATHTLTVTYDGGGDVPPVQGARIFLAGGINEWNSSDANYQFAEGPDGLYTLSLASFSGEFKVVKDGAWLGNTTPMSSGTEYLLTDTGMSNCTLAAPEATEVVFTFNAAENILMVTYKGEEEEPVVNNDIYMRGAMNEWGTSDAYKFELKDGNYVLSLDELKAGEEFKFASENWSTYNLTTGNLAMEAGKVYDLVEGSDDNMAMAKTLTDVVIVLDLDSKAVLITGTENGEVPPIIVPDLALYLIGAPAGEWAANVGVKMEQVGELTWSWTGELKADDYFAFTAQLGVDATDWDTLNANRFSPAADGELVVLNTPMEMFAQPDGAWCAGVDGQYNILVNMDDMTFTVTEYTGVAAIEANDGEAVYFNLQGVRVANPENGLFIRVQNGKAVKVVK